MGTIADSTLQLSLGLVLHICLEGRLIVTVVTIVTWVPGSDFPDWDEGKDWDKWVPYLLFAYREASTGVSPFHIQARAI